ncbi:MAG: hypothetical protein QOH71_1086 [Blastocatellia bacterium]|nr:hypothetical protein [Blastocatellia bacterium]
MKLQSRHHALIVMALLIAAVMACKSSGTSTSSTTDKTDPSKNTNTSTRTTTAPAAAADIAGKYNIVGSNPDGGSYKGTLEIIPHGDVYQFRWDAGTQYDGVGVANGNVVAVAFATGANGKGCGVVDYEIAGDGMLDGKWGYWGVDAAGSERATRNGGSGLEGEYDATGKNPDGKEYKAKLTVEPAGKLYRFVWSNNADGVGIKQGTNVAVGIGGKRCGFVAYQIKADGLDGIWGGYGTDQTGTEKATKQ